LKRTFQLFQLLIVVFGFYAALKYSGNAKYIVSLSSIFVVVVLDKMDNFFGSSISDEPAGKKKKLASNKEADQSEKSLKILLNSKNHLMLVDAVQALFRDIGLAVVPCLEHPMVDRIVKLDEQGTQIAVKVVSDVDGLTKEWDHLDPDSGFIIGEGGKLRLMLIINTSTGDQASSEGPEFEKIPAHIISFLTKHHTVAITTQTLAQIYHLCKEMHQDPNKVLGRIYQHSGGVFKI